MASCICPKYLKLFQKFSKYGQKNNRWVQKNANGYFSARRHRKMRSSPSDFARKNGFRPRAKITRENG